MNLKKLFKRKAVIDLKDTCNQAEKELIRKISTVSHLRLHLSSNSKFRVLENSSFWPTAACLELADYPGHVMRARGLQLFGEKRSHDEEFVKNSTFYPIANLWFDGYITFESTNITSCYIRLSGNELKLAKYDGTDVLKEECSFKMSGNGSVTANESQFQNVWIEEDGNYGVKINQDSTTASPVSKNSNLLIIPQQKLRKSSSINAPDRASNQFCNGFCSEHEHLKRKESATATGSERLPIVPCASDFIDTLKNNCQGKFSNFCSAEATDWTHGIEGENYERQAIFKQDTKKIRFADNIDERKRRNVRLDSNKMSKAESKGSFMSKTQISNEIPSTHNPLDVNTYPVSHRSNENGHRHASRSLRKEKDTISHFGAITNRIDKFNHQPPLDSSFGVFEEHRANPNSKILIPVLTDKDVYEVVKGRDIQNTSHSNPISGYPSVIPARNVNNNDANSRSALSSSSMNQTDTVSEAMSMQMNAMSLFNANFSQNYSSNNKSQMNALSENSDDVFLYCLPDEDDCKNKDYYYTKSESNPAESYRHSQDLLLNRFFHAQGRFVTKKMNKL